LQLQLDALERQLFAFSLQCKVCASSVLNRIRERMDSTRFGCLELLLHLTKAHFPFELVHLVLCLFFVCFMAPLLVLNLLLKTVLLCLPVPPLILQQPVPPLILQLMLCLFLVCFAVSLCLFLVCFTVPPLILQLMLCLFLVCFPVPPLILQQLPPFLALQQPLLFLGFQQPVPPLILKCRS
jgi:hypothetical protein